jgi:hypothetical protein
MTVQDFLQPTHRLGIKRTKEQSIEAEVALIDNGFQEATFNGLHCLGNGCACHHSEFKLDVLGKVIGGPGVLQLVLLNVPLTLEMVEES